MSGTVNTVYVCSIVICLFAHSEMQVQCIYACSYTLFNQTSQSFWAHDCQMNNNFALKKLHLIHKFNDVQQEEYFYNYIVYCNRTCKTEEITALYLQNEKKKHRSTIFVVLNSTTYLISWGASVQHTYPWLSIY